MSSIHRKARVRDLVPDHDPEADLDPGLALIHARVARIHVHVPGHGLTHQDARDLALSLVPNHALSLAQSHLGTRDLDQSPIQSLALVLGRDPLRSLDHVLVLPLGRREMTKPDQPSLELMRTRIIILLMVTLSPSKTRIFYS